MIRPMFSVFDHKAKMYANPFPHVNRGTAMRAIQDQLRNPNDQLRSSAGDYELFELGTFDDESGKHVDHPIAIGVVFLSDLLEE